MNEEARFLDFECRWQIIVGLVCSIALAFVWGW